MISRILGAITGISRDIERRTKKAKKNDTNGSTTDEISQLKHLSDQHSNFLIWYFGFLKHELTPSASYQRHITSLKAMELILRTDSSGSQTQDGYAGGSLSLVDLSWLRSVLDLVVDPFEDVRETAANLLILLSTMNIEMAAIGLARPMLQELEEFCARASTLASKTSRADHSDGVARSYEVLCQWTTSKSEKLAIPARLLAEVEAKLTSAEKDLASAVLEAPIHGTFAALR